MRELRRLFHDAPWPAWAGVGSVLLAWWSAWHAMQWTAACNGFIAGFQFGLAGMKCQLLDRRADLMKYGQALEEFGLLHVRVQMELAALRASYGVDEPAQDQVH